MKPLPPAPQDVRITRTDGTTVRCGVLRDPDNDKPGEAAWIAHPLEPYAIQAGDKLSVGLLPGCTSLRLALLREEPE